MLVAVGIFRVEDGRLARAIPVRSGFGLRATGVASWLALQPGLLVLSRYSALVTHCSLLTSRPSSEREGDACGEVGLPRHRHVEVDEAEAGRADVSGGISVHERGVDPAIEPETDMAGRVERDAAAGAE